MDFDVTTGDLEGNRLGAFPDLAVVEGEAVAADPTGGAGLEGGRGAPVVVERRDAESLEHAAFAVGGDGLSGGRGDGRGNGVGRSLALGGDADGSFEVPDQRGVDHAELVGRKFVEAGARVVLGGHDDLETGERFGAETDDGAEQQQAEAEAGFHGEKRECGGDGQPVGASSPSV